MVAAGTLSGLRNPPKISARKFCKKSEGKGTNLFTRCFVGVGEARAQKTPSASIRCWRGLSFVVSGSPMPPWLEFLLDLLAFVGFVAIATSRRPESEDDRPIGR